MNFKFLENNKEKGNTLIVTTLVIVSISVLLLVSLGVSSRSSSMASQNFNNAQFAFYAVEGAMQETLQHVANDPNWPILNNFSDSYMVEDVTISRTITTNTDQRVYEITGEYKNVNRKLVVTDDKINGTLNFQEVSP